MTPLSPPKEGTVAGELILGLTAYAESLEPPRCERCKEREARNGYRLCKKCQDDDDAAIMAAYMFCG